MLFNNKNKYDKIYSQISPEVKGMVFKNGIDEFRYVLKEIEKYFGKKQIFELLPIYVSIKTYSNLESGNYYAIINYSRKKLEDYSYDDVLTMIAIAISCNKTEIIYKKDTANIIKQIKQSCRSEYDIQEKISKHPDIFETKDNSEIGSPSNPLLLAGLSGVHKYFDNLSTDDGKDIIHKRTGCLYVTDNKTKINYAIDTYKITEKDSEKEICELNVIEYGIKNTELIPKGFKLKK